MITFLLWVAFAGAWLWVGTFLALRLASVEKRAGRVGLCWTGWVGCGGPCTSNERHLERCDRRVSLAVTALILVPPVTCVALGSHLVAGWFNSRLGEVADGSAAGPDRPPTPRSAVE